MSTQLTSFSHTQRVVEVKTDDAGSDANIVILDGLVVLAKPTAGNWKLPMPAAGAQYDGSELKLLNASGQAHTVISGSNVLTFGTKAGSMVILTAYNGTHSVQSTTDPAITYGPSAVGA